MGRVSRRWILLGAAVLVGLAVAIPVASSGASPAGNLARARIEAARLLGLVHVPPNATALTTQPKWRGRDVLGMLGYDEATPNLVDAYRWWTVHGKATKVLAYVTAHLPRDAKFFSSGWNSPAPVVREKAFTLPPVPGVLSERVLAVSVVQLTSNITAIRTDGETVWVVPRRASEKLPEGVREIDITSTAFMSQSPTVAVKVRDAAKVRRIVKWINAMATAQPGSRSCFSLNGPTVSFVFRNAAGDRVARASGMDMRGTSSECNAIQLWIHDRPQTPLIGGDFYGRVQRLLGVRFVGAAMSAHRTTVVRNVLRADGIGSARFGASVKAVRAEISKLLGQSEPRYAPIAALCGLDHVVRWWDDHTANGLPLLSAFFGHDTFRGYQYGDYGTVMAPHPPLAGYSLATGIGLQIGDTLARGRELYGRRFALSSAQGGTWSVSTARGTIDGYAWGRPSTGDVSWKSVVATIDAGDVGCAAMSP